MRVKKENEIKLENKKILITGASSDLAIELNEKLFEANITLGLHYNQNKAPLLRYEGPENVNLFKKKLTSAKACHELIDDFVDWAGGIDCLIQLSGNIRRPTHWRDLKEEDWTYDLFINLMSPFFLAQRTIKYMGKNGGRIILMSTSSASHGGGVTSLAYGTAKAGIECLVKRLAKDCAKSNILVNAVAPGFFMTKFHSQKMKRTKKQLQERALLIPLKRGGTAVEFAGAILFLLSESASYITGQIITLDGGDWL